MEQEYWQFDMLADTTDFHPVETLEQFDDQTLETMEIEQAEVEFSSGLD